MNDNKSWIKSIKHLAWLRLMINLKKLKIGEG